MSHLYEGKIKNMGNAGRNGGEYYTQRPLIKTIVKIVAPEIGDEIYDGAVGSAGFLCEAFDYLKNSKKLTTLSNTDNASISLRKTLLESCDMHTVLDLPGGAFTGAGVKTVVLFFEKGAPTKKVWFYQLNLGRNLGKTNPLNENDLAEFVKLQKGKKDSDNSWTVEIKDIDHTTFDLSVKNPNKKNETVLREPKEILAEIASLDKESRDILKKVKELV